LLLNEAWSHYKTNFKTALSFLILGAFIVIFQEFPNIFITSGALFLDYNFINTNLFVFLAEIVALIAFILLYSVFITIVIFAVRKEMSHVKLEYYLREMINRFSFRIFKFYVIYFAALALIASILINFGTPFFDNIFLLVNLLMLIFSLSFLFVPQAIVVDEKNLKESVYNNFDYMKEHPRDVIYVVIFSIMLIGILPLIEFAFDTFYFIGRYVTVFIAMLFVIPLIEILKTHMYMMKYELIKSTHRIRRKAEEQALKEVEY